MFIIEFIVGKNPQSIVDKIACSTVQLVEADRTAQSVLDGARLTRPGNPADGYQILDNDGHVVIRSWKR
jgi:hypothetical protein